MRGGGGPGVGAARVIGSGGRSVDSGSFADRSTNDGGYVEDIMGTSWIMNESFVLSLSGRTGR